MPSGLSRARGQGTPARVLPWTAASFVLLLFLGRAEVMQPEGMGLITPGPAAVTWTVVKAGGRWWGSACQLWLTGPQPSLFSAPQLNKLSAQAGRWGHQSSPVMSAARWNHPASLEDGHLQVSPLESCLRGRGTLGHQGDLEASRGFSRAARVESHCLRGWRRRRPQLSLLPDATSVHPSRFFGAWLKS